MKTKTIPFDLETAKKIQAGEIEGKIMMRCGDEVRIVCWNSTARCFGSTQPIIAQDVNEHLYSYFEDGRYVDDEKRPKDLVLELYNVGDLHIFKPFQCVLVRKAGSIWKPRLFDEYVDGEYWVQDGEPYDFCIPYKDNDYLIGTDKDPNEQ